MRVGREADRHTWTWRVYWKLWISGWRRQRNVWSQLNLPVGLVPFPTAQDVLSEFGNLKFGSDYERTTITPNVSNGIILLIEKFISIIGIRLFPIGMDVHQDVQYLLIDEMGVVYAMLDLTDIKGNKSAELRTIAKSFDLFIGDLLHPRLGLAMPIRTAEERAESTWTVDPLDFEKQLKSDYQK